jgi:uncharacterized protein involved in outer membrane biogenesis
VVALVALPVGMLHLVPLNNYIPGAEKAMSQRLGVPVTITNLRYVLLPTPQLTLERVGIGKLQEVKVDSIIVAAGPGALLADVKNIEAVDLNGVSADQDALAMGAQSLALRRVRVKAIKLAIPDIDLPPFDADVTIGPDGSVQRALLSATALRVDLAPKDNAWRATIQGTNWQAPVGPGLTFDDINVVAVIAPGQATFSGIEGKIARGALKGAAKASWGSGIRIEGEFNITNGEVGPLLASFTGFSMSGSVTTSGTFSFQGASLKNLFGEPKAEATFTVERGELNNVDIVRAVQSPARDGVRGGKTRFETFTGSLQVNDKLYSYRRLQLNSGPMNAAGNVDVAANGDLSGRVTAELGSKSIVVARANLTVTGSIKTPILKP